MKKILIGFLLVAFSSICFTADQYAYKLADGKLGKLYKITAEQADSYRAKGYTVTSDVVAVYNMAVSFGQEQSAIAKGIIPTAEEKILAESNFNQGEIRDACRSIILVPAIEAVQATETTPMIEAVPAVTLETWLDALIKSSPQMEADWRDQSSINLNDFRVVYALSLASLPGDIDINTIKRAILRIRQLKNR